MKKSTQDEKSELNISLGKANFWFAILWIIMIFDYIDRMAVNAVLPLLKQEFQFTDAQAGLVSSAVGVTIGMLAPVVAILADRWSRRKMISVMVAAWSMATFATGKAVGYYSMIAARLGVGVGEAGYNSSGAALISVWYPKKMRGLMMGLLFSAQAFGTALGVILAGFLAHRYGWRTCFGILAVPGLVLAGAAWFMPDYKARKIEQRETTGEQEGVVREALLFLFKSPSIIVVYLIIAGISFNLMSFATWGVTLFVRSFGMDIKEASRVAGMATLIGFLGAPITGWVADKMMKRTNKGRIVTIAFMIFLSLVPATLLLNLSLPAKNLPLSVAFFALTAFCVVGLVACAYTTVQDIVPPSFRTTAAGFIPFVGHTLWCRSRTDCRWIHLRQAGTERRTANRGDIQCRLDHPAQFSGSEIL